MDDGDLLDMVMSDSASTVNLDFEFSMHRCSVNGNNWTQIIIG